MVCHRVWQLVFAMIASGNVHAIADSARTPAWVQGGFPVSHDATRVGFVTGYMSMRQGPIAAHIAPTTVRVDVRVKQLTVHVGLPMVMTIVDDYSCCAFALGNGFAGVTFGWSERDYRVKFHGEIIVPTHSTYHLSAQALRLASSIRWADGAERYLLDTMSMRAIVRGSRRFAQLTLHAGLGLQQRFALDEGSDHTLVETRFGGSVALSRRVSLDGQILSVFNVNGGRDRASHATALGMQFRWRRFMFFTSVYVPLDGAVRASGAIGGRLGANVSL